MNSVKRIITLAIALAAVIGLTTTAEAQSKQPVTCAYSGTPEQPIWCITFFDRDGNGAYDYKITVDHDGNFCAEHIVIEQENFMDIEPMEPFAVCYAGNDTTLDEEYSDETWQDTLEMSDEEEVGTSLWEYDGNPDPDATTSFNGGELQ